MKSKGDARGQQLNSCLWYEARFSLKGEDAKKGANIGHLYGYVIHKNEDGLWIDELITGEGGMEVQEIMRLLYNKAGAVRQAFTNHTKELSQDRILFIDTLVLDTEYHGTGLAQLAMASFHRLLPRINNGFAYSGTAVLSPAASEDFKKESEKSDVEIERALVRSYERSGYMVWVRGEEEVEGSVTVMGRVVGDDEGQE